jgi:glycosyltransferase involved in cell wall biosynthesis
MNVDVVLITKNQAGSVARLIESVLAEAGRAPMGDVVLVDSASSDSTIELAREYPIRILRLDPACPLSPAAGRYAGFHSTSAAAVLFLDGDMELCRGWLERGLTILRSHRDVAAISGAVIDVPAGERVGIREAERLGADDRLIDVRHVGGAALFRRSVLEENGTFNPYLHSEEEPELCLRIRRAGHRVVELDRPIAFHYTTSHGAVTELLARRRRRFFLGHGQAIRYLRHHGLALRYAKERGYGIVPAFALVGGLAAVATSVGTGDPGWALSVASLVVVVAAVDAVRKRSVRRTCCSLLLRLFLVEGFVRGMLLPADDPARYVIRADVVK